MMWSVSDLATAAKTELDAQTVVLRADIASARDALSSTADSVVAKARAAVQDARDAVSGAAGSVSHSAEAGLAQVAEIKDSVLQRTADTQAATTNFLKENALLVAGIGAIFGAFIAASLPSSEVR